MNKKRKNKKKNLIISFLLLIILVGFDRMMMVRGAGEVQDNSAPGVPSGGTPITGCSNGNTAMRESAKFFGMRVALVDKDGNNLGRVADLWHHDGLYAQKWLWHSKIMTYNGKQNLKKDLSGAEVVGGVETAKDMMSLLTDVYTGNIFWNTTVQTYFPEFSAGIEFTGNDSWGGLSGKIKSMKTKWQQKYDAGEWSDVETTLKKIFQVDSIDYANSFVQFEPLEMLVMWKCNNFDVKKHMIFYGTPSELVNVTKWYGAIATNPSPQERFFEKYGFGIRIESGQDRPKPYNDTSSDSIDFGTFKSSVGSNGYAVSHIWLKEFFNGEDCETLVDIINKNKTEYPTNSQKYHDAIKAVREGDATVDIKDKDGNIHHAVDGAKYDDARENFWMFQENYTKRTDHRDVSKGTSQEARCKIREVNCETAVKNINNYGSNYTPPAIIGNDDYKKAIERIANGDWFYYASTTDATGNEVWDYFLIDKAYPIGTYKGLDPAVYGDGKASCDADTKNCDEALEYIHTHKSIFGDLNTHDYHEAIKAVREGTWEYEETDPSTGAVKILRIDRAYPEHNLLLEANYGNGEAECDSKDDSIDCPGKPPIKSVDPCETGVSQYMDSSDKDNWLKCGIAYVEGETYSSENTGHVATDASSSLTNNVVGNKDYCRVFCYEEVETEFPTTTIPNPVKAGQIFFWGTSTPEDGIFGTVKITKKCSTRDKDHDGESGEGYLFKKWEKEYKDNAKKMIENQLKKGAYEEAMKDENISKKTSSKACYYPLTPAGTCPFNTYNWSCTVQTSSGTLNHDPSGEDSTWIGGISFSHTAEKTGTCQACNEDKACENASDALKQELGNAKAEFEEEVEKAGKEEERLLEAIAQCTTNLKYEYDTLVYFTFKEPKNKRYDEHERHGWKYNQKFESDPSAEDGYNQDNVQCENQRDVDIYTYSCNGSGKDADCSPTQKTVVDCDHVTWEVNGEWTYKYDNSPQFIWWSLKKDSTLVNTENKDTSIGDEYYYSLGFGLPTAFVLPNGEYGDLKAYVINLGDKGEITDADESVYKLPKDAHFDPIADSVTVPEIGDTGKGFEYECTYKVENDIFGYDCKYNGGVLTSNSPDYCDETEDDDPDGELVDIDVAYRLVSLLNPGDDISKAFPGQNGNGRSPNSNWQEVIGAIPDILRADVYQQDRNGQPNLAMYEIFLDVRTITEIRKENETLGDKAYGSFDKVECYGDGDKKYCASEFVSKLHNGGYGNKLEGTCLTTSNTSGRAQDVYSSGCNGSYSFNFSWARG